MLHDLAPVNNGDVPQEAPTIMPSISALLRFAALIAAYDCIFMTFFII